MPITWLLAAANEKDYRSLFLWSFVLILLLIVAFGAYSYLKRWMNSTEAPVATGFTLSDLKEVHRQGKISTEEFEQTKAKMVASAKRMTEKMPAVTPRRTPLQPGESVPESPHRPV